MIKINKTRTKDIELDENISFEDLKLSKQLLDGLKSAGFYKPSPVQLKAIPLGKIGLDLIVQAKSGTGKTCVFTVISLEHILLSNSKALQTLILAPTREVALQIVGVIKSIGSFCNVKISAFIGGKSIKEDKANLKTCQIAVGTPGRILHLINENLMPTVNIRLFILDEADKLLAPEFQDNINLIYSKLPSNKQMITLSATYPSYMAVYVTRYMRAATFVRLNIVDPSLRGIKQYFKITPYSNMPNISFDYKVDSLIKFLSQVQFQQCIIFTNYQLKADSLCKTLSSKGYPSIFISGNIDQNERNNAISQLKEFKCRILVSTDLTSRGIDAENVDLIICMDLPSDPETYLHRIGRAGRYGCEGLAVSFICEKDEASQFETIIDAYNLRVIQFDDNLQDIVSSRNEIKDQFRLDDVTIQKVEISKEELDRSLFEYEQFKNSSIKFNRIIKNNDMDLGKKSLIKLNNPILNEIIEPNLMENTENYFLNRTNFNEKIDLNTIQNNFIGLKNQNKFKSNDILNLKLKFKNDLESKINKEAIHKSEIKNEIINLNEMYKWKQATKKETKKITAIEDQSYLYAYYYNYYFKNYLSQINSN